MKKTIAFAVLAVLAACSQQPQTLKAAAYQPSAKTVAVETAAKTTVESGLPPGTIIRGGSDSNLSGDCYTNGSAACITGFEAVVGPDELATVKLTHGSAAYAALTNGKPWNSWEETNENKKLSFVSGKLMVPTDASRTYEFSCTGGSCTGVQVFDTHRWSSRVGHFPAKAVIVTAEKTAAR